MSQPIGQIQPAPQNNNQPNQQVILPFLQAYKRTHQLLEKFRNQRTDLYPEDLRNENVFHLANLERYEQDYNRLPAEVFMRFHQVFKNSVDPFFRK